MLIPLWVPWTVVAALAAPAWFATQQHRGTQPDRRPDLLIVSRIWAATVVVLLVTAWLTVDRAWVREGELDDAVRQATDHETGQVDLFSTSRFAADIADRLGRQVNLDQDEGTVRDDDTAATSFEVRVRSGDDTSSGPTVCVEVQQSSPATGTPSPLSFTVTTGACEA